MIQKNFSFLIWLNRKFLVRLRYLYFRSLIKKIGKNVVFYGTPHITHLHNISIGDRCTFNQNIVIGSRNFVKIGNDVRISSGVIIETGGLYDQDGTWVHDGKPIEIGNNVWIASGAIILSGVNIGDNSIASAGCLVTRDIPPNTIAYGIPAMHRPLKNL